MLDARSFTYATPDLPLLHKSFIYTVEAATGRTKLWRLYEQYRREPRRADETFWDAAIRKLALRVAYDAAKLDTVPRTGPLVVISNHPFGVLDGIVIGHVVSKARRDFRVLTTSVLY